MKLYYSPGACSLAPHIVLYEAGCEFEIERVDIPNKKTASGADYWEINPKGYVPALRLEDGQVLTEGAIIVQYVADRKPELGLAPKAGSLARLRLQEWLHFIATELHKGFGPLWKGAAPELREQVIAQLRTRFESVADTLAKQPYLTGSAFSIADAYLFVMLGWAKHHHVDLAAWPALGEFQRRVAERPAVRATLQAEGFVR